MRRLWLKPLTPQGNVGGFRVRPRARHSPMLLREASGEAQGAKTRGGGEGGRISGVSQDEKYAADADGVVYMSGLQALVKLPLLQRERDDEKGIRSAGFISGYRGSPLGAYDQQLWNAQGHLDRAGVKFVPGLNEEIAATSVWGTQQAGVSRDKKVDGVFGIWWAAPSSRRNAFLSLHLSFSLYSLSLSLSMSVSLSLFPINPKPYTRRRYGKGPGVDRSTDAMKHANMAGSSQHGGVLCIAGDDHGAICIPIAFPPSIPICTLQPSANPQAPCASSPL
jgi:indolepyruvate ferredoxin oxidoreductase